MLEAAKWNCIRIQNNVAFESEMIRFMKKVFFVIIVVVITLTIMTQLNVFAANCTYSFDSTNQKLYLFEDSNITEIVGGIKIFVDYSSSSNNSDGSFDEPYQTLESAIEAARAFNENCYIIIKPGKHYISKQVTLNARDTGHNKKLVIMSYGDEKAILTGEMSIGNWQMFNSQRNIYVSFVGTGVIFRQLYVNGVKAIRARSQENPLIATYDNGEIGYTTSDTTFLNFSKPNQLEFVYYAEWTNPRCRVDSIYSNSNNTVTIEMHQPVWEKLRNRGTYMSVKLPKYIENAYELLDEPGEWYLDSETGYVFYKPREFENMASVEIVAPTLETLISLQGSVNVPVKNIEIHNLIFTSTTWLAPNVYGGHIDSQNNYFGNRSNLPNAAIEVYSGNNIVVENCIFSGLGGTGIKMVGAIKNSSIDKNKFSDIAGNAISVGIPFGDYESVINPSQDKYISREISISNNYIHHIGTEYRSASAISTGFVENCEILHNEIYDVPYCGIHIGWGWGLYAATGSLTKNMVVSNNFIHNVMNELTDGGAIYTLGATGGSDTSYNMVTNNYIGYQKGKFGALYLDEGSTYWKFSNNAIDFNQSSLGDTWNAWWLHLWALSVKNNIVENNYSTSSFYYNKNEEFNTVESATLYTSGSAPSNVMEIINNSGVQQEFIDLFNITVHSLILDNKNYIISSSEKLEVSVSAETVGRRITEIPQNMVHYVSSNTNVVCVDPLDGKLKGVATGTAQVYVHVVSDGKVFTEIVDVSVI